MAEGSEKRKSRSSVKPFPRLFLFPPPLPPHLRAILTRGVIHLIAAAAAAAFIPPPRTRICGSDTGSFLSLPFLSGREETPDKAGCPFQESQAAQPPAACERRPEFQPRSNSYGNSRVWTTPLPLSSVAPLSLASPPSLKPVSMSVCHSPLGLVETPFT